MKTHIEFFLEDKEFMIRAINQTISSINKFMIFSVNNNGIWLIACNSS